MARFYYRQGRAGEAETLYVQALEIYQSIQEMYSIAATMMYRGNDRVQANLASGMGDWGIALVLAMATDVHLFQQIWGIVWPQMPQRLNAQQYKLIAEGVIEFAAAQEQTATQLQLNHEQLNTLNLLDGIFRTIAAVAGWHLVEPSEERDQMMAFARQNAAAIDNATGGSLGLAAIVGAYL